MRLASMDPPPSDPRRDTSVDRMVVTTAVNLSRLKLPQSFPKMAATTDPEPRLGITKEFPPCRVASNTSRLSSRTPLCPAWAFLSQVCDIPDGEEFALEGRDRPDPIPRDQALGPGGGTSRCRTSQRGSVRRGLAPGTFSSSATLRVDKSKSGVASRGMCGPSS